MSDKYDANSIESLNGLEPVQRRPGMYTDTSRPNHLVMEVVDNSLDEAMAGHADTVEITIGEDQYITISDNGRGIPVDIHPQEKMSGAEVIFDKLHSGGKFSNKNYQFSGGLHGVGISVVNALSDEFVATIKREGKTHHITYHKGLKEGPLKVVAGGRVNKSDTGTSIRFKPTESYFDKPSVSLSAIKKALRHKAVLTPGVHIILNDEKSGERHDFFYESGIKSFFESETENCELIGETLIYEQGKNAEAIMELEWAFTFSRDTVATEAFVNLIPTPSGGTHVNALRNGLYEGLVEFTKYHNLINKGPNFNASDIESLMGYIISLKMQEPQFAGQTKERLSDRRCTSFITSLVKDKFSLYLNQHLEFAHLLLEEVLANAAVRQKQSKKVKRKQIGKGPVLPGKLTDCSTEQRDEAELFFVEGDSAGGSAKQARDRNTQAIMPIRGKILNTWQTTPDSALESQEVNNIAIAIGVDPGSEDLSNLRYGKICMLADADSDGLHIGTLFLTLMVKHYMPLIHAGNVYVAMPPLYRIDVGKKVFYALDEKEKSEILERIEKEKIRGAIDVQRFKGLGEMNPDQLKETTMQPATRRLLQVTATNVEETFAVFDMLMHKKRIEARKNWLESNGDAFRIEV